MLRTYKNTSGIYFSFLYHTSACRGLYRGAGLLLMENAMNYGDGQLDIADEMGDEALQVGTS